MRPLFGTGLGLFPFAIVLALSGQWADALGIRLGAGAAALAAGISRPGTSRGMGTWLKSPAVRPEPGDFRMFSAEMAKKPPSHPSKVRERHAAKPPVAIFVDKETVLRLANRQVRPSGYPVPANQFRPAGLELVGVSALGLGAEDGDVLTHVAGVSVGSLADVVGLVLAARGALAPQISGVIWRGNQKIPVTVEQPYLPGQLTIALSNELLPCLPDGSAVPVSSLGDGGSGMPSCLPPAGSASTTPRHRSHKEPGMKSRRPTVLSSGKAPSHSPSPREQAKPTRSPPSASVKRP